MQTTGKLTEGDNKENTNRTLTGMDSVHAELSEGAYHGLVGSASCCTWAGAAIAPTEEGCGGEISLSATVNSYSTCTVIPPNCAVTTCCPRVLPYELLSLIFSVVSICLLFIECTQYLFSKYLLDWELLVRFKPVWSVGWTLFNASLVNKKLMTSVLKICELNSRVYYSYWHWTNTKTCLISGCSLWCF